MNEITEHHIPATLEEELELAFAVGGMSPAQVAIFRRLQRKYDALVGRIRKTEKIVRSKISNHTDLIADNRDHALRYCANELRALLEDDDG